jgi:creatinine amidohydrolase/Fe(II)-dependent formamide hydrolase-like protein
MAIALVMSAGVSQAQQPTAAERAAAQQAEYDKLMSMERPIDGNDSVWTEELTMLEIRDAMRAGKTTIIVTTGGVEQNGPYLATGKHQYLNRAMCEAIARKLGNALCAPIVPYVPQGTIDPPSGMMRFPGTIGLSEPTFQAVVTDIAESLRVTGFEHVILLGDSGGNQRGLKAAAAELGTKWAATKSRVHYIPEYYDWQEATAFAEQTLGWKQSNDGYHDDAVSTALMMTVDPSAVRLQQRIARGKTTINGISIVPLEKAVEGGKRIVEYRAEKTAAAIRRAVAGGRSGAQ